MSGKMAEQTTIPESFLTCHVCRKAFVSLGCHHNFCSSCLQNAWDRSENKNCPICKRKASMDFPFVNFGRQEIVDDNTGRQTADPSGSGPVGRKHTQDLNLCEDEQRAVCPVCELHHVHGQTLVPQDREVHIRREQLQLDLQSLNVKRMKCQKIDETYDNMAQHCKKQLWKTKGQIKAEFDQLRRFLQKEEEASLADLKEEERQKSRTITLKRRDIQDRISALSEIISAVKQNLAQTDNAAVLTSYAHNRARARDLCSASDPQPLRGGLVDVAKHLGNLSFRVWEKMGEEKIKSTPVVFDPNTASNYLVLSEGFTSVMNENPSLQDHPDNPERFRDYSNILGSEGFSSGKHRWEMDVGDHPHWLIGVANESVHRKGEGRASPENGMWCLFHHTGRYTDSAGREFKLNRNPKRISVQLKYETGEVSFYDPEEKDPICTYNDTFSEKIYPFLSVGPAGAAQTIALRVCGVKK